MDEPRKRQPEADPSPKPRPDLRDAPRPKGPLSGRRTALRRMGAIGCAGINRILDRIPPGRWLHRRVQQTLSFTEVDETLNRGGAGLHGLDRQFLIHEPAQNDDGQSRRHLLDPGDGFEPPGVR